MYAPTAPNTMSSKGLARKKKKKSRCFYTPGNANLLEMHSREVLPCRWKPIWVMVIHLSGAKAESPQLGTERPGTPGRAGVREKGAAPPTAGTQHASPGARKVQSFCLDSPSRIVISLGSFS